MPQRKKQKIKNSPQRSKERKEKVKSIERIAAIPDRKPSIHHSPMPLNVDSKICNCYHNEHLFRFRTKRKKLLVMIGTSVETQDFASLLR